MKNSYHALIDINDLSRDHCANDTRLLNILESAARLINATIISSNRYRFGHNSPDGCTAFLMLDESHISAHTYAEKGKMAIDVFSCIGQEKCEIAAMHIISELGATNYEIAIVERFK